MARTKKTYVNVSAAVANQIITLILTFVVRSIFIVTLGIFLQGIHALFLNVIFILSFIEVGIGMALVYKLYKPLADNNYKMISAYVKYMQKVYLLLAAIVFAAGLVIMPLMQFFIGDFATNSYITNSQLMIFYVLVLVSNIVTYLVSHKRAVLVADQKNYVLNIISIATVILLKGLQMIALLAMHNFYVFLAAQIVANAVSIIAIFLIYSKKYSHLKNFKSQRLSLDDKLDIRKKIRDILISRIGLTLTATSIAIVVSILMGASNLGVFSNYWLIITSLHALIGIVFDAITPSLGNLTAEASLVKRQEMFFKLHHINAFFATIFTAPVIVLLNPFVSLWTGYSFYAYTLMPYILGVYFYFIAMRKVLTIHIEANGIFNLYQWRTIVEAVFAIGLAVLLSHFFGLIGIVVAYIVSYLIWNLPLMIIAVVRKTMNVSTKKYLLRELLYLLIAAFTVIYFVLIGNLVNLHSWVMFFAMGISGVLLCALIFVLFTSWMPETKFFAKRCVNVLYKKLFRNK